MFKIGFIDYFLDEWHANNYPAWIKEASKGEMEVTHAFGLIDSPRGGMTTDQWCEKYGVQKCETIEEVIAQCDGLIVLSPDNAEMHLQLCELPLKSGKPTYVDKTFAPDEETAKKIFAFAEESGTPCYSTSALRYATEYEGIDTAQVVGLNSWGPNDMEIYSIHQIEPICMLMQARPTRVMYLPGKTCGTLNIQYADGRCATMSHYVKGSPFAMNIALENGNKVLTVNSDFFHNFIVKLVEFFETKEIMVPHEETLNVMALRGAGIKASQNPLCWIEV